jgi:hypothetical protein
MLTQRAENLKTAFAEHSIPWPKDTTIFWHPTGPKISYGGGMLKVSSPDRAAEGFGAGCLSC